MNKRFIYSGLLVLGFVIGIVIMTISDNIKDGHWPDELTATVNTTADLSGDNADVSSLPSPAGNDENSAPLWSLKDKVAELEERVLELEQLLDSQLELSAMPPVSRRGARPPNRITAMLTTDSLIKAGIDADTAANIVRRRNELELRKLKLSDSATREGYIGTARYNDALSALEAEHTSLREELGDEAYDHYLYANKQPNRVKASSIMLGSAAELAGMRAGDIVISYGQRRVFMGSELKLETSKGELGEYVSVDIVRDGQLMSLWMPRGPMGVRLGMARAKPGS